MAQFGSDTFTGTEDTELAAYSANWVRHTSYTGNHEISSNRARHNSTTTSAYYHTGTPATADYSVNADLYVLSSPASDLNSSGVTGRMSTAANTFYHFRYGGSTIKAWQFYKVVAGTFTELGSSAQTLSSSTTYNAKLEMIGSAIKAYKEGSSTALFSVTDTAITAAGKAGIRTNSGVAPTDSTLIHLDNFSADDAAAGSHNLTPVSEESLSQVSSPVLAQAHILTVVSEESASQVSAPVVGQAHALTANSVESASEVTAPVIGQIHALAPVSAESASELTAPVLAEAGSTHNLTATSVESASEISTPAIGQIHALTAVSVESTTEVSSPPLSIVGVADDLIGSTMLRANRVKRTIRHITVQPYDAWLGFGIARLDMPVIGDFDTNAILHPGWLIYVTENGTGNAVPVYSDNVANQTHASPVKVDRVGNTPVMWVDSSVTYDMAIKNEFGILRYTATNIAA